MKKNPPEKTCLLRFLVHAASLLFVSLCTLIQTTLAQTLPRLEWSSYHGGSDDDGLRDMAIDSSSNLYVIGSTMSNSGIATAGSYQPTLAGLSDVYFAKYDKDGVQIWSTYFGGNNNDFGQSITVDDQGYIYITGFTNSGLGIASAGAFQPINNGGFADAFVAKFDGDGNRIWSTYFGGNMDERSNSITVDGDGHVTIIGWTNSSSSIASSGAFQTGFQGQEDIYLAQFDNNGQQRWATYYGDIGFDIGLQVAADASNNLVISGWTSSVSNFTTAGAFQQAYSGGTSDAYLAKFSQDGARMWCTFYGGSIDEYGDALIIGANDDIYIAGPCNSPNGLTTPGTHQQVIGGGFDAFIARFNTSGSRLWGSYYGGIDDDDAYGLAIDEDQYLYLTGYTKSPGNIATVNAHQTTAGGDWDGYLARINNTGNLVWGTYLGGTAIDQSLGVEVDSSGYVYITGLVASPNQIATPGSSQENYGGGAADGFVAKFSPCTDPVLNFLNGGYLCSSSNFVFDLAFTGTPPFTFTYSLDGVVQPPVTADMSPFFHLVTVPWSDSIKLLSVHSGPCIGQVTGAFDYVKIVEPVSVSNSIITCNQTDLTYTISLDLSGGVFGYLSGGTTTGFVSGNQYFSAPQPFNQDYDIIIWSGLMCDSVFFTGSSGCVVNCPVDFGTISADTPFCDGADILLQASGGLSYAWDGPDNFISSQQNPVIPSASAINEGVYSVIITDNNNCKDTLSTQVDIHIVQGSVTGDTPVCAGEDIQLSAMGGLSYLWSGPDNFSSLSGNPVIPSASSINDGIYMVTITDQENCSAIYSVDIVVTPPPLASIMGNEPLCEGDTLQLSANGGNTYSWIGPDGFTSNLQNPFIANSEIANAGMYSVTVTDINNCMDDASLSINILDGPDVMIMTNTPLCSGSDILFQGSGADSYSWIGPNSFTSALQNPVISDSDLTDSGLYTLIGTNTNGCRDSITTNINVFPLPVVMATADQAEYCEEETIQLNVNSGTSYTWSGPDGFTSNLQSPSIFNSTTAQQGTYTIQISDVNGCTNQGQVSILVISSPAVTIAGDVSVCEGELVQLTAQGNASTYSWTGPAGVMSSNMIITVPNSNLDNSGTYYLISGNAQNCFSTDSAIVLVQANPVAAITGPDSICAGEEVILMASGGQDYNWNTGETGASLTDFPTNTTAYEVVVSQGECNDTATWIVLVNPLPDITISGAGTIAPGETIMLVASGADQYTWASVAGLNCTTCPDPIAMPDSTTTYCVTGLLNGCEATECAVVMVVVNCDFDLPNVFSPDFDGFNDYWCSPKPDCVSEQHLTIFDRWGNALFDQSGEEVCWDGTSHQKEVNPGVYVYKLELRLSATETKVMTGDIMVMR